MGAKGLPLSGRLEKYSIPEPNTGCLLWFGVTTKEGYGRLRVEGKYKYAHRLSYENSVGQIQDGLELDHLCRTRCCIEPNHLEAVVHSENVRRGLYGVLNKNCPKGHSYSGKNLILTKKNKWKVCRICKNEKKKQWRLKNKKANY